MTANPTPAPSLPILAGDLVVHRGGDADSRWELSAVWHTHGRVVELAPVHSRAVDAEGRYEVFIDWPAFETGLREVNLDDGQIVDMVALDDGVDFETRVVEDRVSNPHGEESEDCWYVQPSILAAWAVTL